MTGFLDGKKTYIGILMMVLGMFGAAEFVSDSEASLVVDSVLQVVGIVVAVYGRYKAGK